MSDSNDYSFNVDEYNDLITSGKHELTEGNLEDALELYSEALRIHHSEKLEKRVNNIRRKIAEVQSRKGDDEAMTFDHAEPPSTDIKTDQSPLTNSEKQKYNEYILKGKLAQKDTNIEKALRYFRKAAELHTSNKLESRISKLEKYLNDENDNWFKDLGDGFFLPNEVYDKLYSYQHEGVKWMWHLYLKKQGGILGDDMGLGKTVQIIVFLQAMFSMEEINTAILVMPLSLIPNWSSEFEKWAPDVRVELYHGSKSERERNVRKVMRRGGVILTTYGIIEKNVEFLMDMNHIWNYLILDEGHKIKNPTRTSKAVRNIPCNFRLLISGTPIQNNLKELWSLFDFVSRGSLLGTMVGFKMNYISPIERGREKDASRAEARLGSKLAENLRNLINPFFLRRTKAEIRAQNSIPQLSNMEKKREICLWLSLTGIQKNLYKAFLTLDTVKDSMNQSKSPLAALTVLKKICDHPRLAIKFESIRELLTENNDDKLKELVELTELNDDPNNENILEESCKLRFTLALLKELTSKGHRTLLFSTSLKILDFVQSLLQDEGLLSLRIDGRINKPGDRQTIIERFNKDTRYSIFLLTTQVGGVGLNLTSADRVIISGKPTKIIQIHLDDPNWNPATDSQAVDRAYRIGQTKPVTVYRLLSCGTIEEKIYRKQIFKDSISRQATGDCFDPIRYFTNQQIRQLFILGETEFSETCSQLEEYERDMNTFDSDRENDNVFLYDMGAVGCSNHDHVFERQENTTVHTAEEHKFINDRIEFAQKSLQGDKIPAYDAKNMAVPLGGGMRSPWEDPGRIPSVFNNPGQHEPTKILEKRDIVSDDSNSEVLRDVIVINSDGEVADDNENEVEESSSSERRSMNTDEKNKISLNDYKQRQMKIYEFSTPSKELNTSQVLNETIDNHIRNVSMKKTSEDESEDEKETTMYDNLNKPQCLDESYLDNSESELPATNIEDYGSDEEIDNSVSDEENQKNELMISKLLDNVNLADKNDNDEQQDKGCTEEQHEWHEKSENSSDKIVSDKSESSDAVNDEERGFRHRSSEAEDSYESCYESVKNMPTDIEKRSLQRKGDTKDEKPQEDIQNSTTKYQDHDLRENIACIEENKNIKDVNEENIEVEEYKGNVTNKGDQHVSKDNKENVFTDRKDYQAGASVKHDVVNTQIKDDTNPGDLETLTQPVLKDSTNLGNVENNKQIDEKKENKVNPISGNCTCGKMSEVISKGYTVTKCKCMCSEEDLAKYKKYIDRGLEHHKNKNLHKAMQYYKAALQYRNDDVAVQKAYLNIKKALR